MGDVCSFFKMNAAISSQLEALHFVEEIEFEFDHDIGCYVVVHSNVLENQFWIKRNRNLKVQCQA